MNRLTKEGLSYITVILLIYVTDTFLVFANRNDNIKITLQAFIVVIGTTWIMFNMTFVRDKLLYFFLLFIAVFASMVYNQDFSGGNIYKVVLLLFGLIVSNNIPFEVFKKIYTNVMYVICVFSLILYPFTGLITNYSECFPIVSNIGRNQVACFGITNVCIVQDGFPRNYGPFWEPGVYATYLLLALIFSLNNKGRLNARDIVLTLGVFSTLSTAGLAILCIVYFDYIFFMKESRNEDKNKWILKLIFIILFIALAVFVLNNDEIKNAILAKFDRNNYQFMSTSARLMSITGNILIWCSSPIFGVGARDIEDIYLAYLASKGLDPNSNTNGFLIQFSMYGFGFGALATYGLCGFVRKSVVGWINRNLVFLSVILMLFAEPLILSALFNTIIFYGIRDRKIE